VESDLNITPVRFMEFTIIASGLFKAAHWSGGTTTELFIYPPSADYRQKKFQFRLSTATVETDNSDFTPLPGISRKLMVLDGTITLIHEGHYTRQLNKFDVDEFEGGWKTSSAGECTDFNLMTTGKTSGAIKALVIEREKYVTCSVKENSDWVSFYIYSGKAVIEINDKTATINKGDLLIISKPAAGSCKIIGIEKSELVITEITKE
jgi:uncharacterized protein